MRQKDTVFGYTTRLAVEVQPAVREVETQHLSTVMLQYDENEQHLHRHDRHGKEVDGHLLA